MRPRGPGNEDASNADKHFDFLVCFILKVFLQENPTKAVGFANFIYLNQLVGNT